MTERIKILVEYVGIERGAVQQVMYRADKGRDYAPIKCRVWDLDGEPYVRCYSRRFPLSKEEATIAREASKNPYHPIVADILTV